MWWPYLPSLPSQYCEGAKENGLGIAVAEEEAVEEDMFSKTSRTVRSVCIAKSYKDENESHKSQGSG